MNSFLILILYREHTQWYTFTNSCIPESMDGQIHAQGLGWYLGHAASLPIYKEIHMRHDVNYMYILYYKCAYIASTLLTITLCMGESKALHFLYLS